MMCILQIRCALSKNWDKAHWQTFKLWEMCASSAFPQPRTPVSGGSCEGSSTKFPLAAEAEIIGTRFGRGFGIHNLGQVLVFTASLARQRLGVSRSVWPGDILWLTFCMWGTLTYFSLMMFILYVFYMWIMMFRVNILCFCCRSYINLSGFVLCCGLGVLSSSCWNNDPVLIWWEWPSAMPGDFTDD